MLVGAVDRAHNQGGEQLADGGLDPQRVGDGLGLEEGGGAEELAADRGRAAVLDQLGPGARLAHSKRSAAAARNSSGSTPQTSQSSGGAPSRARWARIVPS